MMRRLLVGLVACLACLSMARTATAHENLIQPPLRDNTNQKIRPCGGALWGSHVTTLKPGDPLLMQWVETIHHPGWFRISFRASESGDFRDMILAAKVDSLNGIDDYSHTVTLPQVTTQQGSVQLAFVMTDQPNNTMPYGYNEYSNCTDIILTTDANAGASPTPPNTPAPTPSTQEVSGTDPSPTPSVAEYPTTGIAMQPASDNGGGCTTAASLLPWWLPGLVAWRRRRLTRAGITRPASVTARVLGMLALSMLPAGLYACKQEAPPAPKARGIYDLLATVPAQVDTFWAPDIQAGLESIAQIAATVADANAPAWLDTFADKAGVDLRSARGWNSLGIDTGEGVALMASGFAPFTLVVRTRDPVRLDKFINLYAETRLETDGHAISDVRGNTVHSYRNVHWSHVGSYTWLTVGHTGRAAMSRMLQHMKRENGAVAPDHPLTADGNFATDMNLVQPAAWLAHGHLRSGGPGSGAVAAAIDMGRAGFAFRAYVEGEFKFLPVDTTPLEQLVQRFSTRDLIFSAGQYMDFNYAVTPTAAAAPAPHKRGRGAPRPQPSPSGTATGTTLGTGAAMAGDTSTGSGAASGAGPGMATGTGPGDNALLQTDPIKVMDHFAEKLTGLHWSTDVAPNLRGMTFSIGMAPADVPALENAYATVTADVADAGRAAGWLATAAHTMEQQNVTFRRSVETVSGTSFTLYRTDHTLLPWLTPKEGGQPTFSMAVVNKSVVLAVGTAAFDDKIRALAGPKAPSPWLTHEAWTTRGKEGHGFGVLRLGRFGDMVAKWIGGANAQNLPTAIATVDPNTTRIIIQIMQKTGDVISTATRLPGGQLLEWSSNFTTQPDPPGILPWPDLAPLVAPPPEKPRAHTPAPRNSGRSKHGGHRNR